MRRTDFSKVGLAVLAAIIAGGAVSAAFAQDAQSRPQDQPSVADAARAAAAAKKDKEKSSAPKTVITEDSLGSGAVSSKTVGGGAAAAGTASGTVATAASGDAPNGGEGSASLDAAWARLQATEATLDRFEPLGKSEVAATVLGGYTGDFPGRAEWEEKMYTEKTAYVARSRQLILAMKEALLQMAQMNSGDQKLSSHDPRVVSLTRKTTQLMQLAAKTEAEFQGVVSEGRALAQAGK
ncbi:MAG TPA: hypothetical protein VMP12_13035 [Candidatus Sulfotelmatobacter sp.]|nr:hypothetical protein [Candidatus Sulfotelmatobacter sp.]